MDRLRSASAPAADALLQLLFERASGSAIVLTPSGRVHAANAAARPLLADADGGVEGAPLAELVSGDVQAEVVAWTEARAAGQPPTPLRLGPVAFTPQPLGDGFVLLEGSDAVNLLNPQVQRLAEALPGLVWSSDPAGRVLFRTRTWHAFTGAPDTLAPGADWTGYVHPDDLAAAVRKWHEALRTHEPFQAQYRLRRHDGAYVWHMARSFPHRRADGQVVQWIGVLTDLTPEADAEAALGSLLDELGWMRADAARLAAETTALQRRHDDLSARNEGLEGRNRALHDFAYMAGHDLQEPLRKVLSYADLLRLDFGDALPPAAQVYLDRMHGAATRMSALLRSLLAYSRLSASTGPFAPVALDRVLDDVLDDLDGPLRAAGAEVDRAPLPTVLGDEAQLRQLVQNLVHNAVKYHRPDAPPRVTIGPVPAPAGQTAFAVADNGRGFTPTEAERIFVPFVRLSGGVEGTGFGLPIVQRIAERHGGVVTAEGIPGAGATFTVTLPAAP